MMTKRNVGVDLLRVIATVQVIILHILGQGGILAAAPSGGAVYWTAWFLEIFAYCAVNCFGVISGYVMVDRRVKAKNIIVLWIQALFYSLLISTLFFIFMPDTRSGKNLIAALLPIVSRQWWYLSSYFGLFFLMPFINEAIKHISRQTYKKFLLAVMIVVCFIERLIPFGQDAFSLGRGYSVIWLAVLYLFGAYVKKYEVDKKITAIQSLLGFFSMILLTFASKYAFWYLPETVLGFAKEENTFVSYLSITILLAAVFLLLFCLRLSFGGVGAKIVGILSPVALGVYMIHVHPFVFRRLLTDLYVPFINYHPAVMTLCVLGAALGMFVVCGVIEWLRILLFRLIRVDRFSEFLARCLNRLYVAIFERKTEN